MLMHADNRRINHLHRRIMGGGQRVHDPAPDTSPSPSNEAVVAGGVRARHAVSTGSVRGIFGRYPPKSGPVMLTLSFVKIDPALTHESRSRPSR